MMKTILAIDPGLSTLGWSLMTDGIIISVEDTGMIMATKEISRVAYRDVTDEHGKRLIALKHINDNIDSLLTNNDIHCVVIEDAFYNPRFPNAYGALVQVIHAITWVSYHKHKLKTILVPTRLAKQEVTGSGGSGKLSVEDGIYKLDDLIIKKDVLMNEHIADAIAVGYTLIKKDYKIIKKKKTKKKKTARK